MRRIGRTSAVWREAIQGKLKVNARIRQCLGVENRLGGAQENRRLDSGEELYINAPEGSNAGESSGQ
jgi:hypothetical protein